MTGRGSAVGIRLRNALADLRIMTGMGGNELRVEEVPVSFEPETVQDLRRRLSGWRTARTRGPNRTTCGYNWASGQH
jgi:hypothetical protein